MGKIIYLLVIILSLNLVGCNSENQQAAETSKENVTEEIYSNDESSNSEGENIERIKDDGKLILATSADSPPFEWHIVEAGKDEIVGLEIEMAKAIADNLGVALEVKDMDFEGIIPAVQNGQADLAMGTISPNEEREKVVDFSDEYFQNQRVAIVRKEDADKYKTIEDFAGKIMVTQTASSHEAIVKELFPEDIELKSLPRFDNMIMEIKNKTGDAIICIDSAAKQHIAGNDDLTIIDVGVPAETGARIVIGKGKDDLTEVVNETIKQLKHHDKIDIWYEEFSTLSTEQ